MPYLSLIAAALLTVQAGQPPAQQPKPDAAPTAKADTVEANASTLNAQLMRVTRIYVDDFGSEATAKQIQAMVVNSISESKKFIITENKEKADAILKGTALEKTSQEFHSLNDKVAAASSHSAYGSNVNGSVSNGTGSITGSSGGYHSSGLAAADDSTASSETINDARVAVRLVATDGDVIWSTTQESRGAKYKGASADVADKVVKQLMRDLERLQAASSGNTQK